MVLTIIITVFNSKSTIFQTIESVKSQFNSNIEVLFIDDGSTDGTEQVIKENIWDGACYYRLSHGGVSNARNFGINHARGSYIWFVDGDDFVEKNAIEYIVGLLSKNTPDIIMANYSTVKLDKKKKNLIFQDRIKEYSNHEEIGTCLEYLLEKSVFDFSIWKNIYNREFLIKNNIFFDIKLFMNEDGNWLFEVFSKANSMLCISQSVYIYNLNNNYSITKQRPSLSAYRCSNYVYTRWYSKFNSAFADEKVNYKLKRRMSNGYANSSVSILSLENSEKNIAKKLFLDNIDVINDSNNLYGLIIKTGKLIGYNSSLKLAYFIYRIVRFIKK